MNKVADFSKQTDYNFLPFLSSSVYLQASVSFSPLNIHATTVRESVAGIGELLFKSNVKKYLFYNRPIVINQINFLNSFKT